jgi:hypothetical protein
MQSVEPVIAPGSRVVVRDAEWVVRRVDSASDGGQLLTCDGISELVRHRTGKFLTRLEPEVRVLDPAATELVADPSDRYRASLLYMESLLRQATPNDDRIHVAHKGAMDLVPYQIDPALQSLGQPRQRILIADAVGLGKTLEAGIRRQKLTEIEEIFDRYLEWVEDTMTTEKHPYLQVVCVLSNRGPSPGGSAGRGG